MIIRNGSNSLLKIMWKLLKPRLADAYKDIETVIAHCNELEDADRTPLRQLYADYDHGSGAVTDAQLKATEGKKDIIRGQYAKTSGKVAHTDRDKHLVYIRKALMGKVDKCPYCSINEPQQLDHFMDKDTYGQLATCRLNLVPLCGTCNNLKGQKSYKEFTHPYYQDFPDCRFLIARCTVIRGCVHVQLLIDKQALGNNRLYDRLVSQMDHIRLKKRLKKSINEFLTQTFMTCSATSDAILRQELEVIIAHHVRMYNKNDWRTAVLYGLKDCPDFNMAVVRRYRNNARSINGIGA